MGAIAPSKVPKLIKKRDGDEPVKVFKQGGKVNEAGNYTKPGLRERIFNSIKSLRCRAQALGNGVREKHS
jgi:hypothetical protein